jgi:NADPH2:quinone reductase
MRAMVIEEFGGPEKLKPADVDKPEVGHGEILVKVLASGTNPVEAKVRAGIAYPG